MNPVFFMGGVALMSGIALSRRNHSAFGWLGEDSVVPGEDPAVPGEDPAPANQRRPARQARQAKANDYDPRKYNRATFIKTHIAKKFWGSAVLSAQSAQSMRKLADRVRSSDANAANNAEEMATSMEKSSQWSARVARENNAAWVGNRKLLGAA